jgi:hypothetical protein
MLWIVINEMLVDYSNVLLLRPIGDIAPGGEHRTSTSALTSDRASVVTVTTWSLG